MGAVRGLARWLAWGALGPLLLLLAVAVLERGLEWLRLQPGGSVTTIAGAAQVLAALSLGVVGALDIVSARLPWSWAAAVVAATWALIVSADFAAAGYGSWALENSGQWTVIAVLLGFYAYHCHVPGYWGWRARRGLDSDSRLPAEGAQGRRGPSSQP